MDATAAQRQTGRAFDAVYHRYRAGEPSADIDLGP